jgi:hypothetical protein
MSDQPKCDRCQTEPATGYDGTSRLCSGCEIDLRQDLFRWSLSNEHSPEPVVEFEILQVGQVWRKIYRQPEVVAGRLTGNIEETQIDLVKRTFYRLIDQVTGETSRRLGDSIVTDLQRLLPFANDRMVVEEFEAWVAVKDGEP